MERRCFKCDGVNSQATGSAAEACPRCGAIHAKVEALLGHRAPVVPGQASSPPAPAFDMVRLRRALGVECPGPDIALTPEQLMLLFVPSPTRAPSRGPGAMGWGVFLGVVMVFIIMSQQTFRDLGPLDLSATDLAPPPSSSRPLDADPADVIRAMRADPLAAMARWKGQDIRLRAPVVSLGENPYVHRAVVKLHSGDPHTPVYAEMLPGAGPEARTLAVAQPVAMVCSTVRWGGDRLILKGCDLDG